MLYIIRFLNARNDFLLITPSLSLGERLANRLALQVEYVAHLIGVAQSSRLSLCSMRKPSKSHYRQSCQVAVHAFGLYSKPATQYAAADD